MTPSDEMVERVAEALFNFDHGRGEAVWGNLSNSMLGRRYRASARDALAAMKDSDVYKAGFEAGRASADGDEFAFSGLFGQVGALLMNGDAESMLLWFKDGRFNCTFSISNFDEREQNPAIDVAIAGAVVKAEAAAREKEASDATE